MTDETAMVESPPAEVGPVLDDQKLELLKRTICSGATDDEFQLFVHACRRTGLDPFMRQIHAVKRWDNRARRETMSIQTGIDGYRLIADRTGKYAGSDDYLFDDGLSQYAHLSASKGKPPATATVTVYKLVGGQRVPFTATAAWDAYVPAEKQRFMWAKMPYVMLGKCAEALALRKAFPAELSGVYTHEEMAQAGAERPSEGNVKERLRERAEGLKAEKNGAAPISNPQMKRLWAIARECVKDAGCDDVSEASEQLVRGVLEAFGLDSTSKIRRDQYDEIVERIAQESADRQAMEADIQAEEAEEDIEF